MLALANFCFLAKDGEFQHTIRQKKIKSPFLKPFITFFSYVICSFLQKRYVMISKGLKLCRLSIDIMMNHMQREGNLWSLREWEAVKWNRISIDIAKVYANCKRVPTSILQITLEYSIQFRKKIWSSYRSKYHAIVYSKIRKTTILMKRNHLKGNVIKICLVSLCRLFS